MNRFVWSFVAFGAVAIVLCGCGEKAPDTGGITQVVEPGPGNKAVITTPPAPASSPAQKAPAPAQKAAAPAKKAVYKEELLFTGNHPWNAIGNGDFEYFYEGSLFPHEWIGWYHYPVCASEKSIKKFGEHSVKITGLKKDYSVLISKTAPPLEKVYGKKVTFGAWVYTSNPKKTDVVVYSNLEKPPASQPTKANEWQLVKVTTTVPEDAETFMVGISLKPDDNPVVCYVDGASLYIDREL